MNPAISVIIPIYNAEKYIKRCIDSILKQTFLDYEVLLVNDGSIDDSELICRQYLKTCKHLKLFNKSNGGVSQARNFGLYKAQGKYIVFIDSDDFIENNYLESLYKGKDCDLSLVGIKRYNLDSDKEEEIIAKFKSEKFQVPSYEGVRNIIDNDLLAIGFPWGKLFKKDIIEQNLIRFDERITNYEDHLFFFDYLIKCHSIYLDEAVCYNYTYSSKLVSLSHLIPQYKALLIASNEFMKRYPALFKHLDIKDKNYIKRITSEYGIGTRRASIYSLYHNSSTLTEKEVFLKEQCSIFKELYKKYGYKTKRKKHMWIYLLICIPLPICIKNFILSSIYK